MGPVGRRMRSASLCPPQGADATWRRNPRLAKGGVDHQREKGDPHLSGKEPENGDANVHRASLPLRTGDSPLRTGLMGQARCPERKARPIWTRCDKSAGDNARSVKSPWLAGCVSRIEYDERCLPIFTDRPVVAANRRPADAAIPSRSGHDDQRRGRSTRSCGRGGRAGEGKRRAYIGRVDNE